MAEVHERDAQPATATTAPAAAPRPLRLRAGTTPSAPPTTAAGAKEGGEDDSPLRCSPGRTPTPTKARRRSTVEFKADIEGGKPPLKYLWKFGDGSPDSTDANPKHTYEKAGKYRADLEVNDSAGDSDSDYVEIDVQ